LGSEVQPAQANVSTTNAVVDSSRPIQTQLSVVHNNNDILMIGYPKSAKAVKHWFLNSFDLLPKSR